MLLFSSLIFLKESECLNPLKTFCDSHDGTEAHASENAFYWEFWK